MWLPVTGFLMRQQLGANGSSSPFLFFTLMSNRVRDVFLSPISRKRSSIELAFFSMRTTICLECDPKMSTRLARRPSFHFSTISLPVSSVFFSFLSSAFGVTDVGGVAELLLKAALRPSVPEALKIRWLLRVLPFL